MKKAQPSCPISVIIPVYNAEAFLNETIDSVLSQTFTGFELLALDDGSTDSSKEILYSYKDERIRYVSCTHDFINTLNKGIKLSKGKYIALLDHDDIMMPYRLMIQYDFMEKHPEVAACGGYMHSFGKRSELMNVPIKYDDIFVGMLLGSIMLNPTGFIRKSVLIENNIKYRKGYSFAADYKMWADIAKAGMIVNIPKVLTLYRTSDKQASVVYRDECENIDAKIQNELQNYFLSHLKEKDKYTTILKDEFIPMINKLGGLNCFSQHTFSLFMYEIITYFREKGIIKV